MAVDAIGISGSGESTLPRNASISQDAFIKILLTQLQFQDPLKPIDNQQFIAQLAQFSALEINRQQSEKVDSLMQINATGQAVGLLGRNVEISGASGAGTGEVTAVSFASGQAALTVRTPSATLTNVRLSDIRLVLEGT
jgi:flagellar basal-body rod modification protein FlgD